MSEYPKYELELITSLNEMLIHNTLYNKKSHISSSHWPVYPGV